MYILHNFKMLSKLISGIREISNPRKKFESYISLFTGNKT